MDVGKTLWCGEDVDYYVVFTLPPIVYSSHSSQRDPLVFVYQIMSLFWSKPSKGFSSHLELNSKPLSILYSTVCMCCFSGFISLLSTCHLMRSSHWSFCYSSSMLPPLNLAFAIPSAWYILSQISTWLVPSSHSGLCSNLLPQRDLLWWK